MEDPDKSDGLLSDILNTEIQWEKALWSKRGPIEIYRVIPPLMIIKF